MYSKTYSAAIEGMEAHIIMVEADVCDGLPLFSMVGYLSSEAKEAKERVRIAMKNTGYRFPPKHITINLSPAGLRKDGTAYDLSIAAALLASFGYLNQNSLEHILFLGELTLDGKVRPVRGVLPAVLKAKEAGMETCILPAENAAEGAAAGHSSVFGVETLEEMVAVLKGNTENKKVEGDFMQLLKKSPKAQVPDFSDVIGQHTLKRALETAVSGMHHFLMIGPPGVGKSMIARRIPGIMPDLTEKEALEISKIYSIAGLLKPEQPLLLQRPFRAPHHTITPSALVGGGMRPSPGEISLAQGGVLFLDEMPEFTKETLDLLRQPLEEKAVTISRLWGTSIFPAEFMLVGAANPCKCGYYPDRNRCRCREEEVRRYRMRISGPVLDRIDICAAAVPVKFGEITGQETEETSEQIRERVMQARKIQLERYQKETIFFNAWLTPPMIRKYCSINMEGTELLEEVFCRDQLSARAYHKIVRVARTVADLHGSGEIKAEHIMESICYRMQDAEAGA